MKKARQLWLGLDPDDRRAILGVTLIVLGVSLLSVPGALVVAGLALLVTGLLGAYSGGTSEAGDPPPGHDRES